MKKLLFLVIALLGTLGFSGLATVSAISSTPPEATAHISEQTRAFLGDRGVGVGPVTRDVRVVVGQLIQGSLGIIGVLFIAYAFYGGMMILTSAGDEDKINTGKSTLRTATIGIVVVLSALGITTFVTSAILRGTGAVETDGFEFGIDPNYNLPLPPEDPSRGYLPQEYLLP
jgi:hypothetical protein